MPYGVLSWGSSPRMRGSLQITDKESTFQGIIPAYAGLTAYINMARLPTRDHPRVCGAHCLSSLTSSPKWGSSPRMRGSRRFCPDTAALPGIIPAYAGLTRLAIGWTSRDEDHPRVCGAHLSVSLVCAWPLGSSPRMRGSLIDITVQTHDKGIIPAYAGLTCIRKDYRSIIRDHPRVCGAHSDRISGCSFRWGSSPRMRGSPRMCGPGWSN